jgi:phosphatidate phosphatase APP1
MKKQIVGILLTSTLVLAFTGCATAWEHKTVVETGAADGKYTVDQDISTMTQQGWHLVSVSSSGGSYTKRPALVLVFKRHK